MKPRTLTIATLADRAAFEVYFWQRVEEHGACLLWTGTIQANGYGRAFWENGHIYAHRAAWELASGPISGPRPLVCHDCDRLYPVGDRTYRRCVHPAHLFLGTNADNILDRDQKGRHRAASGSRHGMRRHPERAAWGSRNGQARLDEAAVLAIRTAWQEGGVTQQALATRFGVCRPHVSDVVNGKKWAHLPLDTGGSE